MKRKKALLGMILSCLLLGCAVLALSKDAVSAKAAEGVEVVETDMQGNVTYNTSMYIAKNMNLNGHTMTVNGDLEIAADVNLGKGTLIVNGNILQTGGVVRVEQGVLEVAGDYRIQDWRYFRGEIEYIECNGALEMTQSAGCVFIGGDFITQSTRGYTNAATAFRAGTMEIGGDIIQREGHRWNLSCINAHKVVLKGNKTHIVDIEGGECGFQQLESEGPIVWKGYMRVGEMLSDLEVRPESGLKLTYAWLGADQHELKIDGGITITGNVSLNSGKMKINGDVLQTGGVVRTEKGTIEIAGNYQIQGDSALEMFDADGLVKISGDFTMESTKGYTNAATAFRAGTMEVGGDIIQREGHRWNLSCINTHKVVLKGNKTHIVDIEGGECGFQQLESEGPIVWKGYMRVGEMLSDLEVRPESGLKLTYAWLGADQHELKIDGGITITGNVSLNNGKMKINGDVLQTGGVVRTEKGTIEIAGNYQIQDNSALEMFDADGLVKVSGDFTMESTRSYTNAATAFRAGTMEVGGDIIQRKGHKWSFRCISEHKIILNGTKPQKVEFESEESCFNHLVVTQSLSNYTFSRNPCWNTLEETAVSVADCTIKNIAKKAYTGKAIQPALTITYDGTKLVKGTDYTVKYSNNKKTGKATVTITGIGAYTGTAVKTFQIVPAKATGVSASSNASKTVSLTWNKDSNASGYVIEYSTDKTFQENVGKITIKKNTTVSRDITKLTSKKTYYFRIRAYKTIDGKKAYGSYSAVKSIKVQ